MELAAAVGVTESNNHGARRPGGRAPGRADRRDPDGRPRRRATVPVATRGLIARFLKVHDAGPVRTSPLVATLTEREREIVALIADGMSNAEIARQLTLSPLTVKTHANHAMTKLGARDRAQLVVLAYQTGLARPPMAR
jgi:DNA-binding CsgD family transcriptional regulator